MLIVKSSKQEIRKRKGRFDRAKMLATSEADIEHAEREEGYGDDSDLGPPQVIVPGPDVKALRAKLKLNQDDFADRFGFSPRTVQEWEQRRRSPDGSARLLIELIEIEPDTIARLVAARLTVENK